MTTSQHEPEIMSTTDNTPHDQPAEDPAAATEVSTSADEMKVRRKSVTFATMDVAEFEPTAWTATVASDGVPLGLSTQVRRRTRRRVDSFESERQMMRVDRQEYMELGYLEPEERLDILEHSGHTMTILSHVEKESIRINRERWESNEYDLMYQYALGEVPILESDDDEEMILAQMDTSDDEPMLLLSNQDDDYMVPGVDDYFQSSRNALVDAEVRYAMEEMDAYDTRKYEELNIMDYDKDSVDDCILGDDDSDVDDENNQLPYAKDSFESPSSEASCYSMSSSPSDVSAAGECLISVSCSPRNSSAIVPPFVMT